MVLPHSFLYTLFGKCWAQSLAVMKYFFIIKSSYKSQCIFTRKTSITMSTNYLRKCDMIDYKSYLDSYMFFHQKIQKFSFIEMYKRSGNQKEVHSLTLWTTCILLVYLFQLLKSCHTCRLLWHLNMQMYIFFISKFVVLHISANLKTSVFPTVLFLVLIYYLKYLCVVSYLYLIV